MNIFKKPKNKPKKQVYVLPMHTLIETGNVIYSDYFRSLIHGLIDANPKEDLDEKIMQLSYQLSKTMDGEQIAVCILSLASALNILCSTPPAHKALKNVLKQYDTETKKTEISYQ